MSRKKIMPPTYLYIAIGAMLALYAVVPGPDVIPAPLRWLGLIPLVLGTGLNLVADQAFKRARTTVKPFEESDALVTDGVFRLSRNPMYLGFVLGVLGIAMLLRALTPFLAVVGLAVWLDVTFIRAEEQMLAARFGEAWTRYAQRVRRWL